MDDRIVGLPRKEVLLFMSQGGTNDSIRSGRPTSLCEEAQRQIMVTRSFEGDLENSDVVK
jgi:hypothetical protein